jgi:hypothetical protein
VAEYLSHEKHKQCHPQNGVRLWVTQKKEKSGEDCAVSVSIMMDRPTTGVVLEFLSLTDPHWLRLSFVG